MCAGPADRIPGGRPPPGVRAVALARLLRQGAQGAAGRPTPHRRQAAAGGRRPPNSARRSAGPWTPIGPAPSPPADHYIGGRALIARLLRAIGEFPTATLRRDTALVELVRTDGRVVGAVVETGGERRAVRARRGVLLAAGGFEANPDLRRAYGVPGQARDTMGGPGSRGLALQAGIAVGADTDLLDQAWWSPGLTHPDGRSAFALWFTGGIFVNQSGDRFVNESMVYDRAGRQILAQLRDGSLRLPYWMIYDDK
nr:FAD-binding protein [Mycobacterium lepraemurium]